MAGHAAADKLLEVKQCYISGPALQHKQTVRRTDVHATAAGAQAAACCGASTNVASDGMHIRKAVD